MTGSAEAERIKTHPPPRHSVTQHPLKLAAMADEQRTVSGGGGPQSPCSSRFLWREGKKVLDIQVGSKCGYCRVDGSTGSPSALTGG